MARVKRCPSCGAEHRKGSRVLVSDEKGGLVVKTVCARCAAAAVRILVEPPVNVRATTTVKQARCSCGAKATHCVGCALRMRDALKGAGSLE